METKICLLSIIVEESARTAQVNELLHQYGQYIIGRMGLPYRQKDLNLIAVMLDAPAGEVNALAGKLGRLEGIVTKTLQTTK